MNNITKLHSTQNHESSPNEGNYDQLLIELSQDYIRYCKKESIIRLEDKPEKEIEDFVEKGIEIENKLSSIPAFSMEGLIAKAKALTLANKRDELTLRALVESICFDILRGGLDY